MRYVNPSTGILEPMPVEYLPNQKKTLNVTAGGQTIAFDPVGRPIYPVSISITISAGTAGITVKCYHSDGTTTQITKTASAELTSAEIRGLIVDGAFIYKIEAISGTGTTGSVDIYAI